MIAIQIDNIMMRDAFPAVGVCSPAGWSSSLTASIVPNSTSTDAPTMINTCQLIPNQIIAALACASTRVPSLLKCPANS